MKVRLPFRPAFRGPMLLDEKILTCRPEQMGDPGDTFEAFGATFRLTHVFRTRLGYIIADAYRQEGCRSVQELMDIWNSIHPKVGVGDGSQTVWAHCFVRVSS